MVTNKILHVFVRIICMVIVLAFIFSPLSNLIQPVIAEDSEGFFSVRLNLGEVIGGMWSVDLPVTLTINGVQIDQKTPIVDPQDPNNTVVTFELDEGGLAVGQEVTLSNGEITRTQILPDIKVTEINQNTETVSGTAPPGSNIRSWVCANDVCLTRHALSDEFGNWSIDYSVNPEDSEAVLDITIGSFGEACIDAGTAGFTSHFWEISGSLGTIEAQLHLDTIIGWMWSVDRPVTLTINGIQIDQKTPDVNPNDPKSTVVSFKLSEGALAAGQEVTLSNGEVSRTIILADIFVTEINQVTDTVSGTAAPESIVRSWVCSNDVCLTRFVTADEFGQWSINYAVNPENSQAVLDITIGSYGEACTVDGAAGYTGHFWGLLNVNFEARLNLGEVIGWYWSVDQPVTLTIEGVQIDQKTPIIDPQNPSTTVVTFELGEGGLIPGQEVSLSNGEATRTLILSDILITEINQDTDTVSGTADVGLTIRSWVCSSDVCLTRFAAADENGQWSIDYSVNPENNQAILDITTVSFGEACIDAGSAGFTSHFWEIQDFIDTDNDGIKNLKDNAPYNFNPDQRDIDHDGKADVIDPCPSDATNTCNASGSISTSVTPEGGSLIPPNGAIELQIPEGALTETTSMSITDKGSGYVVTTNQGPVVTVTSADIGPAGTHFVTPITITFNWLDADNNGIVDDTFINEGDLVISKDGVIIAGPCNESPYCDKVLNSYSIQVSSLSYFVLGVNVISSISTPINPVQLGLPIKTNAELAYPRGTDALTAIWSWDDGSTTTGTIVGRTVSGEHKYLTPGVYIVKLQITDNEGITGFATSQYIVIYDPNGGFVSGGGWITSPLGAYTQDLSMVGKATFGFTSQYKKGANVPTGNTEFQFQTASFTFSSTSYDWLVVAGSKAQFKGKGTINGSGNYGFMLTGVDGQPDRFRIKIWNISTSTIIFDNMLGTTDDSNQVTALGGGSIVIHK